MKRLEQHPRVDEVLYKNCTLLLLLLLKKYLENFIASE